MLNIIKYALIVLKKILFSQKYTLLLYSVSQPFLIHVTFSYKNQVLRHYNGLQQNNKQSYIFKNYFFNFKRNIVCRKILSKYTD